MTTLNQLTRNIAYELGFMKVSEKVSLNKSPEENSNNFDYIYDCKKYAQSVGLEYYSTVNWKKGNFVSNTGRKAKNTEQMVFFTKGKPRNLKLDAKKNLATAKANNIDLPKSCDSHMVAAILEEANLDVSYMCGTAKMLPTIFDVENVSKAERIHQAEKPVRLFEELLEYITKKGELVLDQFSGSGNLGRACLNTFRNAILIEKNFDTYQVSTKQFKTI